ncbi:cellobiose dehydrogenase [Pseudozyma hubeiensis SY62]|uniref:Cellobiose dehydrogenase n=1 Tax=Pseudozyma hubeiensis (strain SY62) TaxID=1305764 RepID=R9P4D4_PSEHS|nr:cellobiose dehydrogenase [Pseudozyma hubeiensis SY62]GAC96216.1 cellobiose dehydrogenase [Pseudozyma hubeiensis SY62]
MYKPATWAESMTVTFICTMGRLELRGSVRVRQLSLLAATCFLKHGITVTGTCGQLSCSLGVLSYGSAASPRQSSREATFRERMAASIDCPGRGGSPAQARDQLACRCSKENSLGLCQVNSAQRINPACCSDSLRGNVQGGFKCHSSALRLCPKAILHDGELIRTGRPE